MRQPNIHRRSGAAAAEAAVVLPTFFILVFGMLDLSIALLRNELLSEAARAGARTAIIHGQVAGLNGGTSWGPSAISVYANNSSTPIAAAVSPYLVGFNLATTKVQVQWPDGGNAVQQRVQVTVSASYQPIMTSLFGKTALNLSATSTMPIAH